jgi:hypothetical protein
VGYPGGAVAVGQGSGGGEPYLSIQHEWSALRSWRRFLTAVLPALAAALTGVTVLAVSGNLLLPFERVTTIEGKTASKRDYFEDVEVQRLLMKHHIRVHLTGSGSLDVARADLDPFDFAFLSGQPAGQLLTDRRAKEKEFYKVYRPFVSPIVLATYRGYAETLQAAGIATAMNGNGNGQEPPLYFKLNLNAFFSSVEKGTKWNDIGAPEHGVSNGNRVLAQVPDVCRSNSGYTYLALVAFTRNGGVVPTNVEEADALARKIKPLLTAQGLPLVNVFLTYASSEGKGVGPVVVAYEHQYLAYQARYQARTGTLDTDRVLLYPSPQSVTQPEFVALNNRGDRLGDLIVHDPELRNRAMELGFRILGPTAGEAAGDQLAHFLRERGIPVPDAADDTKSSMSTIDLLERMISIVGDCASAPAE